MNYKEIINNMTEEQKINVALSITEITMQRFKKIDLTNPAQGDFTEVSEQAINVFASTLEKLTKY